MLTLKKLLPPCAIPVLAAALVAIPASPMASRSLAGTEDSWPTPLLESLPEDSSPDGYPMSRGKTDLDSDGHPESWTAEYLLGSGAGDIILTIHPGKGGEPIVIDWQFVHEDIVDVVALPRSVGPAFLAGITRLFFGEDEYCGLDISDGPFRPCNTSLRWLAERTRGALPGNAPLDSVHAYTPIWTTYPPHPSRREFTVVGARTGRGMVNAGWNPDLLELPDDTRLLLIYESYKHGGFHSGGRYGDWTLQVTDWGVVVEDLKNKRFSWTYVVDRAERLGGSLHRAYAPQCISDQSSDSGLIVIEQDINDDGGPPDLIIVEPLAGRWARLLYWEDGWSIDPAAHVLVVGDRTFRLSDLKRALTSR